MQQLTLKEISKATNGELFNDNEISVKNVVIDTRKIEQGSLFVAIKGENFDGHTFIEKAYELGATASISHIKLDTDKPYVLVEDTRKALGDIASYYKGKLNPYTVGVTGSVGKTSTKEMIYTVLADNDKTLKTLGNLNNDIGLPLTLLSLEDDDKNAVIEMGMSNLGEISYLSKITQPNIAVITNVGVSHMENLGSRENILKAKLEILDGMQAEDKVILNIDNDMLYSVKEQLGDRAVYFGIENKEESDIYACDIIQEDNTTSFTICYEGKEYRANIPTVGNHNVYNALVGFIVGKMLGISGENIVKSLKKYKNHGMRQNITKYCGITIIEDCYNASPDSMQSAVNVLELVECKGKRYVVFGDMLELGKDTNALHSQVGELVAKANGIEALFCYGEKAEYIKQGAEKLGFLNVHHYNDKEKLTEKLKQTLKSGDSIIFKASRGMKLETVIEGLKQDNSEK